MRPAQHGVRRPAPAPRYGPTVPPGVVLVTGGSRGIGAATARAAAAAGWSVALTYRDDEAAAAAVVAGIVDDGGAALVIRADVSVEDDVVSAFAAAAEGLGPVTGLVANAGIVGQRARVDELTADRVQRMLAVNVLGTVLCCREAVRRMSTRYGGPRGAGGLVSPGAPPPRPPPGER